MMNPKSLNQSQNSLKSALSSAFQSLAGIKSKQSTPVPHSVNFSVSPPSATSPRSPDFTEYTFQPIHVESGQEALITIEFDVTSPHCPANPSDETIQVMNIQFNSLDLIANQQTLVELISFANRVMPGDSDKDKNQQESKAADVTLDAEIASSSTRTEVTAEFHRLNILLMRALTVNGQSTGKKVATATLTGAKIQATLGNIVEVQGSLGGLQLMDLTPEGRKHQKIFTVGSDPISSSETTSSMTQSFHPDMYKTAHESMLLGMDEIDSDHKAFKFHLWQVKAGTAGIKHSEVPLSPTVQDCPLFEDDIVMEDTVFILLRMASLTYTHSPRLLHEMSECATEFKDYMASVAESLKYAATDVAMGLMNKKSELLGASFYGSTLSLDGGNRTHGLSFSIAEDIDNIDVEDHSQVNVKIDALFQTPIVVMPKTPSSSEVLVAHLGQITLCNAPLQETQSMYFTSLANDDKERLYLEIRDMSLYSMDIDEVKSRLNISQTQLYSRTDIGYQILHDTLIEMTIEKLPPLLPFVNQTNAFDITFEDGFDQQMPEDCTDLERLLPTFSFNGRIVNRLHLSLSKSIYEQILKTVDNLTYSEDLNETFTKQDSSNSESLQGEDELTENQRNSPSLSAENQTVASSKQPDSIIRANFDLPVFNIEMEGDFGEGNQGLVNICLQEFNIIMKKVNAYSSEFIVSLKALDIEDLFQDPKSKHRHLMVSAADSKSSFDGAKLKPYLSTSCPDSTIPATDTQLPSSLPASLYNVHEHTGNTRDPNVYAVESQGLRMPPSSKGRTLKTDNKSSPIYPSTPPPSRRDSVENLDHKDNLVHIKVVLIDNKKPEYVHKYNKTNRFIDINFNCLDTCLNLQTWVVLLDFLGLGAKIHDQDLLDEEVKTAMAEGADETTTKKPIPMEPENEIINSEINLNVQSLSLLLNKQEYELAKANISAWSSHLTLRDNNFHMIGKLGSISLLDNSPHGELYRERFMTVGDQALDFDVFKYGTPDPVNRRPCDVSVKVRMASVRYLHTQRFWSETLAFIQHFNQLQDVLGRMRAASAGKKIAETAQRGSRISLDIEAGSPVILIPHSSISTDVLVMDLGTLTIRNGFLVSGQPGTIAMAMKDPFVDDYDEMSDDWIKETTHTMSQQDSHDMLMSFDSMQASTDMASLIGNEDYIIIDDTLEVPSPKTEESSIAASSVDLFEGNSMTQSVYGSLEHDERTDAFTPAGLVDSTPPSRGHTSQPPSKESSQTESFEKPKLTADERRAKFAGHGATRSQSISAYNCLLDVMYVNLVDIDLYSAERIPRKNSDHYIENAMVFPSHFILQKRNKPLKEKCVLKLQVERNLEGDISHTSPDLAVLGMLSAVHFCIDLNQYKLVRGILDHNFGEPLEEFQTPVMTSLQDPQINTILSGQVWKCVSMNIDLLNVSVELQGTNQDNGGSECPLARLDFIKSRLTYESFSDFSKDVDLVSREILAHDTRYRDSPVNTRPNVFSKILQPSKVKTNNNTLQLELHYRSTNDCTRFTILLNNMRLMGIFDWLMQVQDFLLTNPDNPFEKIEVLDPLMGKSTVYQNLKAQTVGVQAAERIVTKRAPIHEKPSDIPFEMKVNITETDIVLVENMAALDTNAVILKMTAVLAYKPKFVERPLSASLQSLEVFSCCLASETETALSIIDPMTVTIELHGSSGFSKSSTGPSGLLDATVDEDRPPLLEIGFSELSIRVSYNDIQLFMAIMNSLPNQAIQAKNKVSDPEFDDAVVKLMNLGFKRSDCEKAMKMNRNRMDDAAFWLTQNASNVAQDQRDKKSLELSGIEMKAGVISICLIDDCQDADVPLIELSISDGQYLQKLTGKFEGSAMARLSANYYNRILSGWEPCLEPWQCDVQWRRCVEQDKPKYAVHIQANDALCLNITSVFVDQYYKTKTIWTEDYYNKYSGKKDKGLNLLGNHSRRVPFTPFLLRNRTGVRLYYSTVTSMPSRAVPRIGTNDSHYRTSQWKQVDPGEDMPFMFEGRDKIRHKNSHQLKVHQVVIKLDGWYKTTPPVSVDKIGIYFRNSRPEHNKSSSIFCPESTQMRIVFDVSLEGSAKKVITVRSALLIKNKITETIQLKFERKEPKAGERPLCLSLSPGETLPVPITHVHHQIWARPLGDWSVDFCNKPVHWQHVTRPGDARDSLRSCSTLAEDDPVFRFCVAVKRENYPADLLTKGQSPENFSPGHTLTITPPVIIENLLPVELAFYFKGTDVHGAIKPGKSASLYSLDLTQALELGLNMENFPQCRELVIPPGTSDYMVKVRVIDSKGRLLNVTVSIKIGEGGTLKLSISVPYWLINKSGLPLIFRQENAKKDAAGQFEEHELARSVAPLLFSFTDKEAPYLCTMRIGRSVHQTRTVAKWCQKFTLERGVGMRQLHVVHRENSRPDWVYNIGIEVQPGHGRYKNTNIVTFSPRFQLDNRTKFKLAFAQRHLARSNEESNPLGHLTAVPNCNLPFHWPRLDLDQLLCVTQIDDPHCQWSGGFRIDRVDSFHINMRGENNVSNFLRVEVVYQGSTFYVVFTNVDQMPPPFRIDNFSEVPIKYYQTNVMEDRLRTIIKPHSSEAYAWDEPTLAPHITLSVQGGTIATYSMKSLGDGDQLCYENFIYIAFTGTFQSKVDETHHSWAGLHSAVAAQELVLDVVAQNLIVLKRKEPGRRSQLWRMTSTGRLQHEGSAVPRYPHKKASVPDTTQSLVLDIADIAPRPGAPVRLMLRKLDDRRKSTQTWLFTDDGRLKCSSGGKLYVQARGGPASLSNGCEVILGPCNAPISQNEDVPVHMAISRQKLRPGSGLLSVRVVPDGPTRVLQITDIAFKAYAQSSSPVTDWVVINRQQPCSKPPNTSLTEVTEKTVITELGVDLQFSFQLQGFGVSLVNHVPEELIYLQMEEIQLEYMRRDGEQTMEVLIRDIQIDNQLLGCICPLVLYVTPAHRKQDSDRAAPALHLTFNKVPDQGWHAEIYRYLVANLSKMTILVEERLLWKLFQFFGYDQTSDIDKFEEGEYDNHRIVSAATSVQAVRYYFGILKIVTSQVIMSMLTTSKLPPDLLAIKNAFNLPLIKFEEAKVELDPFVREHPFENGQFLLDSIQLHYTEELKSQAAKILGSVDFLGNPLGLFNDVTEGISGLVKDGNVGGLFKNVTHGITNSAAKFTGSLSDGLNTVSMDEEHQSRRETIRQQASTSSDHFVAGVKGLGYGLVGGMTSIITQTYHGASKDGIEGFFTGFGKGVVGTVAKPVAGVLDFASGAASALRDTSRSNSRNPRRKREPRCCHRPGGLLPIYSKHDSEAQKTLFMLNHNNYSEMFIAMEQLRTGHENPLQALITSLQVYFLRKGVTDSEAILFSVAHAELYTCRWTEIDNRFYIELTVFGSNQKGVKTPLDQDKKKRPIVRCDSEAVARRVAQHINYAKTYYDEMQQTLFNGM
ncbi:intermembrane lipid transfer protein VPS13D-like [Tubulanus polymorphus]|uniref:intermembrane lipid transfer protein VPS13D-like n=1 Tax=Tubulanus polymorphus TaxID=672921 RepID=UPI003DA5CCF9